MGEKVIVALDRADAETRVYRNAGTVREQIEANNRLDHTICAALDRDRDALFLDLANLIDDGVRGRNGSVQGPVDLARAVLAAIERADQEEGDRG